jgi:hypothetical protein
MYLKVSHYFLRVLMFDIFVDWPKNFALANINYMHYTTLEYVNLVPFPLTNHKIY